MEKSQIAAQLYTLRDFLKTPKDIAQSLHKLAKIGYRSVQVSGMGPIPEEELNKILDNEGLVCCATHEPVKTILEEPQLVVERLDKLNCKYTACPNTAGVIFSTYEEVLNFAKQLDYSGSVLKKSGKVLTYHNHQFEFARYDDKLMLDIIYDNSDKDNLQSEIDTYWVQYGGCNPAQWCQKLSGRIPLLHLKDYALKGTNPVFAEIGYGNLDWHSIIKAAEQGGCQWFIVEQDTCQDSPFDCLERSFRYLCENFVK